MIDSPQQVTASADFHNYNVRSRIVAPMNEDTSRQLPSLIFSVCAFLDAYSLAELVYTDEPLLYELTPRGRAALSDALERGRVSRLRVIGDYDFPPISATVTLSNNMRETNMIVLEFGILLPTLEESSVAAFHAEALTKDRFSRLHGAVAGTTLDELGGSRQSDYRRIP